MFTPRELDIMGVLWEHGPSTVAEVRAHLGNSVSHNTVATMLTILENKGRVEHSEEGRAFRYRPLIGRDEAGRSAISRITDTVFGGSAEALLVHFIKDRRLTRAELSRLRALLDDRIDSETGPKSGPRRKKT